MIVLQRNSVGIVCVVRQEGLLVLIDGCHGIAQTRLHLLLSLFQGSCVPVGIGGVFRPCEPCFFDGQFFENVVTFIESIDMVIVLVGDNQQVDGLVVEAVSQVLHVGSKIVPIPAAAAAIDHHSECVLFATSKLYEEAVACAHAVHADGGVVDGGFCRGAF